MKLSEFIRYYFFTAYNRFTKNELYKYTIDRKSNRLDKKEQLRIIKEHARQNTKFYNYKNHFPIVNKGIIQKDITLFISEQYKKEDLIKITTSGSYGTPSVFYRNTTKKMNQIADVLYFGSYVKYYFGVKHAFIRGIEKSKISLFVQNEIHLSPNKLNKKEMENYYIQLKKVSHIVGFPSVLINFIDFCEEFRLKPLTNISGITCTAEPLSIKDRDRISSFFKCDVLTRYASEEVGIIANRLPNESFYRINDHAVELNIYKIENDELQDNGKEGRIVITDLHSHAMPLINYDTGDLGIIEDVEVDGENIKVLKTVTGRLVEQLFDENDEKISPFAINVCLKEFDQLGQFQFIQKDKAKYVLMITNIVSNHYMSEVLEGLHNILGRNIDISISNVDKIPSLSSGKRPYIRNEYKGG